MKISFVLAGVLGMLALCHADAVRLKIVGPDGKPVAGAEVRVRETKNFGLRETREAPLELHTDAMGAVSFQSKNPIPADKEAFPRLDLEAQIAASGLALTKTLLHTGDNSLTLTAGHALNGEVRDENEKPVAGVRIALRSLLALGASNAAISKAIYYEASESPIAVSDARGKWHFEGMPAEGRANLVVADERFANEYLDCDVSHDVGPLFLSRAARLKGRLVKPDGSGAGGVQFATSDWGAPHQTNADGTFEVGGLGEGFTYLSVPGAGLAGEGAQKLPFIVSYKRVNDLQAGQTLDTGDWKTEAGIHVVGRVLNALTKKPVEGAGFGMWRSLSSTNARSDKDGKFDFLALNDVETLAVEADGFLGATRDNLPAPVNGIINAGTVELEAQKPRTGQTVKGTVQNEAGLPIGSTEIVAKKNGDIAGYAGSEDDGTFSFSNMGEGDYTLEAKGSRIVSGGAFTVGKGAPKPLQVVIEGKNPLLVSKVEGRVLDEAGRPVAGAKIRLHIANDNFPRDDQTVVSSYDGTYSAPFVLANALPKVTKVSRAGFIFNGSTGVLKQGNGVWRGDIQLQHRGSQLRGHVVDAKGKPVPNAFVGLLTSAGLPAQTDDKGEFALPDVPLQNVTLLASDGPRFASLSIDKAGGDIRITLPDAAPAPDKTALADEMLKQARFYFNGEEEWDALGDERMVGVFSLSRGDSRRYDNTRRWNNFLRELETRAPQTLLLHEDQLREVAPEGVRPELARLGMEARAVSPDEAQRDVAKAWLKQQQSQGLELVPASVTQLLGIAAVAARFDAKAGQQSLDSALQVAAQLDPPSDELSYEWGVLAARVSPDAALALAKTYPTAPALEVLHAAIATANERGDAGGARRIFATMERIVSTSTGAPNGGGREKGFFQSPKNTLDSSREQLILALAKVAPAEALDNAFLLSEWHRSKSMLVVGKGAVKLNQLAVARRALEQVFDGGTYSDREEPPAVRVAQGFDPAFGATLLARILRDTAHEENASLFNYARACATAKPGQSRVLLEQTWVGLQQSAARKPVNDAYNYTPMYMGQVSATMALIDPKRALEMVEAVPEKDDERKQTRVEVAAALLSGV